MARPLVGLSDHFVSEGLYLSDPDGHGIELYWDRPREVWEGQVAARMTTLPLDVDSLLGELDDPRSAPFDGLPAGTVMGHVHLKVADIADTVTFYRDALGFVARQRSWPPAVTTITSVRIRGRVVARPHDPPALRRSATRRSYCLTAASATSSSRVSASARTRAPLAR